MSPSRKSRRTKTKLASLFITLGYIIHSKINTLQPLVSHVTLTPKSGHPSRILQTNSRTLEFQALQNPVLSVPFKQGHTQQCSCFNPNAGANCCKRRVHQAHKMGTVLTNGFLSSYTNAQVVRRRYLSPTTPKLSTTDYRDVVVIRNIYDAIASGYLYHKSGRECWLNPMGDKWGRRGMKSMLHWTDQVLSSYVPDPPAGRRTLCEYMKEESGVEGMRAYMAWVIARHYEGLPGQWEVAQLPTEMGRTLFVCFEDLTNPDSDRPLLDTIADFLYPGTDATWKGERTAGYTGSHGTSHDETLRESLRIIIEELDRTDFDGWVARFDAMFPCRSLKQVV